MIPSSFTFACHLHIRGIPCNQSPCPVPCPPACLQKAFSPQTPAVSETAGPCCGRIAVRYRCRKRYGNAISGNGGERCWEMGEVEDGGWRRVADSSPAGHHRLLKLSLGGLLVSIQLAPNQLLARPRTLSLQSPPAPNNKT